MSSKEVLFPEFEILLKTLFNVNFYGGPGPLRVRLEEAADFLCDATVNTCKLEKRY